MPDTPILEWYEQDPGEEKLGECDLSHLPRELLIKLVGVQTWENVRDGMWQLHDAQLRVLADVLNEPLDGTKYDYFLTVQSE